MFTFKFSFDWVVQMLYMHFDYLEPNYQGPLEAFELIANFSRIENLQKLIWRCLHRDSLTKCSVIFIHTYKKF